MRRARSTHRTAWRAGIVAVAHLVLVALPAQSVPACDYLTADLTTTQVTDGGDRPVWSPDGKRIAYVTGADEAGEAFEVELRTGEVRCLTCHFEHLGVFRVHYLANGDFLLITRWRQTVDLVDRSQSTALEWLSADLDAPPVRLETGLIEGIAVSRRSMTIAWNIYPALSRMQPAAQQVWMGKVDVRRDHARLVDAHVAYESTEHLEVQDFFPGDDRILATTVGTLPAHFEIVEIELASGAVVNHSRDPLNYNEPEGISPDGRFTFVESDRDTDGSVLALDVYALRLDGTGRNIRRITNSGPFPAPPGTERATPHNPSVSPDGRRLALGVLAEVNAAAGASGPGVFVLTFDC